jgi:tetratricopeptide (TPR) repeat protein
MMLLIFLLVTSAVWAQEAAPLSEPTGRFRGQPCTSTESWSFTAEVTDDFRSTFLGSLSGKFTPVDSFADALALRSKSYTDATRALAEYWISRSIYSAGLPHVARMGFTVILKRPPRSDTQPAQLAALACLNEIERRFPTLDFPHLSPGDYQALLQLNDMDPKLNAIVREAAMRRVFAALRKGQIEQARAYSQVLAEGSAEMHVAQVWIATRLGKDKEVIREARSANALLSWPGYLESSRDETRLYLARSLYRMGQYQDAIHAFRSLSKRSNWLAQSLTGLAWSQIQNDNYNDAIGTALSMRTGVMTATFAPEVPMVLAMSMNELCQYPESLKAIAQFRRDYEASFKWLSTQKKGEPLYPLAVEFLKAHARRTKDGPKPSVPTRIGTELIGSAVFITHQEELNLLIDERTASGKMESTGAQVQRQIAQQILEQAKDLSKKIAKAREQLEDEDPLPEGIRQRLGAFRKLVNRYGRIRQAAGPWRAILARHEAGVAPRRVELKAGIEKHLAHKVDRMRAVLEDVAENHQLIEIEILNGASQDLVWQNANPGFREVAGKLGANEEAQTARSRGQLLDWGRAAAWTTDEEAEIWEDELGGLKTDLFDNCASRDKYLAIRKGGST